MTSSVECRIRLVLVVLALGACDPAGADRHPRQFETAVDTVRVSPASEIMLVYIGAHNCSDCRDWESEKSGMIARLRAKGVEYRESISPKYSNTASPEHWPDDIRWITTENAAYVARGTPRFLVLVDGTVVRNRYGRGGHSEDYIDRLVDARSGRSVAVGGGAAGAVVPETEDVAVSCRREGEHAVLALEPAPGVRLNAEYGVSVASARGDRTSWGVGFPYVHKEAADYFAGTVRLSLPVLRADAHPSLRVEYGYCASAGLCMADDAEVRCN